MKIKEIQTIVSADPPKFDECVNLHLKAGYTLVRRGPEQVGAAEWALYAELVKLDEADMEELEDEPITWQEAVNVLRETCETAKDCDKDGCPVFAWCQRNLEENSNPPACWDDPEELERPE